MAHHIFPNTLLFVTAVFKIHCKILSMYLRYYLRYVYFKILNITVHSFALCFCFT